MFTVILATKNRHKVRELSRLVRSVQVRFLPMDLFRGIAAARETGATFRRNAEKKARVVSRQTILPVLAEDSGIEVRALGGRPGVRSARFAGFSQDDKANNDKLLRLMAPVPPSRRQARFVCCMALAIGGKVVRVFEGSCPGVIAPGLAGKAGFGYDPLFVPCGCRKTMAQLGSAVKDRISHRAKAAVKLEKWLKRFPYTQTKRVL